MECFVKLGISDAIIVSLTREINARLVSRAPGETVGIAKRVRGTRDFSCHTSMLLSAALISTWRPIGSGVGLIPDYPIR